MRAVSTRPELRLNIAVVLLGAFIAVALIFGVPAPAHAVETTYVSNIGQSNSLAAQLFAPRGQQFTTGGGAAGFYLGSVDLVLTTAPGNGTLNITVREVNASGNPGDLVYALTNPASIGTGIQNFQAPEGAWLAANTSYFVHLAYQMGAALILDSDSRQTTKIVGPTPGGT